jgi:arsenite methyltransferase
MTKHDEVKEYYGKVLNKSEDLKTNACCTLESVPKDLREILPLLHDEVKDKYYGCGIVKPEILEGMRILDLGSGSGRDVYVLSKLVGPKGYVLGVDMTDEQLDVAKRHQAFHQSAFDYKKSNVEFKKGFIEKLDELNLEDNSFDIVISNCVLNLSPDKQAVLDQVYRILKPGGEFYFSDVYADRRISDELINDPVLYGECLSGALYWNDFLTMASASGFLDVRKVKSSVITVDEQEAKQKIGHVNFSSITYRLFKIPKIEKSCEDFGQTVTYKGSIPGFEETFDLDDDHHFVRGQRADICGNTYRMLNESRYKEHFFFSGSWDHHFGLFDCGPHDTDHYDEESSAAGGSCC